MWSLGGYQRNGIILQYVSTRFLNLHLKCSEVQVKGCLAWLWPLRLSNGLPKVYALAVDLLPIQEITAWTDGQDLHFDVWVQQPREPRN